MWSLILVPLLATSCIGSRTREPTPPHTGRSTRTSEMWFNAKVDHFHPSNTDTYPMRFFYNAPNSAASDHILIFVGGEWSITSGWVEAGLMYELGQEIGAGLFYTEHRYYGQSWPTNDTSISNLRWLTVDQSLADLAQFITYVKSDSFQNGMYRDAKVGLVGCSYAGSMATWMRLAYPHLVDAAFSDSGPLHAQEDFPEYLEVITTALRDQGGQVCVNSVESAMNSLLQMINNGQSAQVSQMFNTCTALNAANSMDLATFFWYGITETFAGLVQYAVPGDIPAACQILTDANVANPVQRLANWITTQSWTQPCIETRYSEKVASHTNTNFEAVDATMRLWTFQTCVEYGWYQSTSSPKQPFLNTVPLEYFHQMCKDFFSTYFDESNLRSGIERTNLFFAGLTHLPDRVVSVAGGADPWSPMGPNAAHSKRNAPVYVVPGTSHCRAIRPTASAESTQLASVQTSVKNHMAYYLTGDQRYHSGSSSFVTKPVGFIVALAAVFYAMM